MPLTVFPISGKSSVLGGVIGRAPFTPASILRDSAASEAVGRFTLFPGTLLAAAPWYKLTVERPTIVMSLTADVPADNGPRGPAILYNYGKVPDTDAQAQVSERTGICLLSNAGVWYLKNADPELEFGLPLDCLLYDASNPEVAARFLRQPGVNRVTELNFPLTDPTIVTTVTLGRYVRSVTLQNVPNDVGASGVVRYAVGQPANYLVAGGVPTGVGFRLLVNGAVTLQGDGLTRGVVQLVLEAAGASAVEVGIFRDL